MNIEGTTSDEDGASSQQSNSSLPGMSSISQAPKHFFRSRSNRNLVIRIRIKPRPVVDRLPSTTHPKFWPSSETFLHQYEQPPTVRRVPLTTLTLKFDQMKVTLRKQPLMLRFKIPRSSTPLWDRRLRAFPPEIRNMIFKETLRNTWDGRTPDFIKALRSSRQDQDMYYDAMREFYKTNCYTLCQRNGWCFADMEVSAIRTIQILGINIGYVSCCLRPMAKAKVRFLLSEPALFVHWSKLLWGFSNARPALRFHTLHPTDMLPNDPLRFDNGRRRDRNYCLNAFLTTHIVPLCVKNKHLPSRKHLKTVILNTQLEHEFIVTLVRKCNARFGMRGKLANVSTTDELIWFWDVEKQEGREWQLPDDMDRYEGYANRTSY